MNGNKICRRFGGCLRGGFLGFLGSLVTVAVHSPDDGRPLYEDVPRGNVSLGGAIQQLSA
eukprot:6485127-Amphidinium_carterae.2